MLGKLSFRRNLVNYTLNTVMIVILLANLFPIGWMIYNSLKGNTEILSGEVGLKKAENNVTFIENTENVLYIGTSDGALTRIDKETNKTRYYSLRSLSTQFLSDRDGIWIASSDKGLVRVNPDTLYVEKKYAIPRQALPTVEILNGKPFTRVVDVAQIGKMSMAVSPDKLWLAAESVDINKIVELHKESGETEIITVPDDIYFTQIKSLAYDPDGKALWVGTDSQLLRYDLSEKCFETIDINDGFIPPGAQTVRVMSPGKVIFQTTTGVYVVDTVTRTVINDYFNEDEVTSVDEVNCITACEGTIYLGTNSGVTLIDQETGEQKALEARFAKLVGEHKVDNSEMESSEVRAIYADDKVLIVGGSSGRTTVYDNNMSVSVDTIQTEPGHIVMFARGWRNYIDMWPNVDFWKYLKNSFIICGATMLIAMILATMTAYALVRFNFPGRQVFSTSILVTQMIPAIFYLIPIFMLFNYIKSETATWGFLQSLFGPNFDGIMIKGSYPGLIFIYSAWFLPFSIWILRGFFAAIPVELEEAATIDGCSNWGVFWKITLPLAVPGIVATGIFILIQAWDELMFAWMLTNETTQTLPVGIRLFVGNFQNRYDLMMAAATVATLPVLVLFFMLQKHIVKGLTAGAVKG